ncbi:hypothetical protein ACF07S_04250 [Streptomyces sp. NPDC016640]|uniref:hypothetical protein n=1 Tax=Streptomyces sp. NPDC016640 TaxID=3364969 RepID=UPI0036FEF355
MPNFNAPDLKIIIGFDTTGAFAIMDGQSDDDCMISDRDLSDFTMLIMTACCKAEVASIISLFETSMEYFSDNFPDLAKRVAGLPEACPHR